MLNPASRPASDRRSRSEAVPADMIVVVDVRPAEEYTTEPTVDANREPFLRLNLALSRFTGWARSVIVERPFISITPLRVATLATLRECDAVLVNCNPLELPMLSPEMVVADVGSKMGMLAGIRT